MAVFAKIKRKVRAFPCLKAEERAARIHKECEGSDCVGEAAAIFSDRGDATERRPGRSRGVQIHPVSYGCLDTAARFDVQVIATLFRRSQPQALLIHVR